MANVDAPKYLRYEYADYGVNFAIPLEFRNVRIQVNYPFPPIFAYPIFDNIHRIAIDFELTDKLSQAPPDKFEPPIILTVYLTHTDLAFTRGDFFAINIYKWSGDRWATLNWLEFGLITPPLRARNGEKYIAYCRVPITSIGDPPIAVG